jgi:hypothetical protein
VRRSMITGAGKLKPIIKNADVNKVTKDTTRVDNRDFNSVCVIRKHKISEKI